MISPNLVSVIPHLSTLAIASNNLDIRFMIDLLLQPMLRMGPAERNGRRALLHGQISPAADRRFKVAKEAGGTTRHPLEKAAEIENVVESKFRRDLLNRLYG